MKRFILAFISLVLFVSCFLFSPSLQNPIHAGAGMGTNHKVETPKELSLLLTQLLNQNTDSNGFLFYQNENLGITKLSSNKTNHPTSLAAKTQKQHNSATISIVTSLDSTSSCDVPYYSNGVRSQSQSLTRELSIFIDGNTTLYKSKGTENYSKTVESQKKQNSSFVTTETKYIYRTFNFDMDILVIDEDSYINIRTFSYETNEEIRQIKYENINKWIQLPSQYVSDIVDVDSINRSVLSSLGEMLSYLIETDEIKDTDQKVTFSETDLKRIFSDADDLTMNIPEDADISFSYDISSPTTPFISMISSRDMTDTTTTPSYKDSPSQTVTTKNKIVKSEQITIKNIDNTVVSFDDEKIDIIIKNEKNFDNLFAIEERKTKND